jgi:hypothetical protein
MKIVEQNNWSIGRTKGKINQAFEGQAQSRISDLENAIIRSGEHKVNLEVAKLSENSLFFFFISIYCDRIS